MTNCRRVQTASGAILAGAARLAGDPFSTAGEALFDPQFWSARGGIVPAGRGRGEAWFLDQGSEQWVLRHYRRGGFVGRISEDRYFWIGEARVRAFAEYRLLEFLVAQGMPVPAPIAARYRRHGPSYSCDLITRRIVGAAPLSEGLATTALDESRWRRVGAAVGRLHAVGVDHADLNAHNILLDALGTVSIIDFDRGRIRRAGAWTGRNLRRLRRSLLKITADLPADRFNDAVWRSLLRGYSEHTAERTAPR
ncbi:MAG TPA: 3-deoxy-D-manno-octulosonic acid kinase [Steroidobacteraceae bacterium]|nr:3-deoxy-D-manno-octulosonic acid kinase [Steroidobacteraceae bacterium]